jgi:hypothetical protein
MKKSLSGSHWYDFIVRIFRRSKVLGRPENCAINSPSGELATMTLPILEEWANPEACAA